MSSIVNLTGNINHNYDSSVVVQTLSTSFSPNRFIEPLVSPYNSNYTISHTPGPPLPFYPATLISSTIVNTTNKYYPFWLLVVIGIFGGITSVLTVLGNILVMLAFFLDRQIRQPTNYFILSLSVSDFLIGLFSMPLLTFYIYSTDWPLNAIICDIWLSLDYTVCLTSIYTVLFITIDRFCSVKMPAKYRKWRTGRKINIMIAITWAVPTLIFFTATMIYPRLKNEKNLKKGVCDTYWNQNRVFNLCLTIGYFWTTLFVMIVLYIFIYGVASNLERKSRENARKMSSLVGMAGNTMTQIGVGIGGNRSPTKLSLEKQYSRQRKIDSTTGDDFDDEDPQNLAAHSVVNTQNSSNSSEQRRTIAADDENSNSFESHSDFDGNNQNDRQNRTRNSGNKSSRTKNRRGMSVNWGSGPTVTSSVNPAIVNQNSCSAPAQRVTVPNQKHSSNVKFFATTMAHSLYRNPMRLSGLSSAPKTKVNPTNVNKNLSQSISQQATPITLTPIPSESELTSCRVYPPPQPRPESLAIMSEELFHERLKARHPPLPPAPSNPKSTTLLTVNNNLSTNFPSTSSFLLDTQCIEDVTYSNKSQCLSNIDHQSTTTLPSSVLVTSPPAEEVDRKRSNNEINQCLIELQANEENRTEEYSQPTNEQTTTLNPLDKRVSRTSGDSSDESWRLLNSNSSLDEQIPYIDETDFEDLGYILHRRRLPPINSNEPIQEETIVYRSPFYVKKRKQSNLSSFSSLNTNHEDGINRKIYEIYGNHPDAHKAILESSVFDSVELITYVPKKTNPSPIHRCSLRNVPRDVLLKNKSKSSRCTESSRTSEDERRTTSSIIFVSKARNSLSAGLKLQESLALNSTTIKSVDVEKALIDFYQCSQIDESERKFSNLHETSESEDLEYSLANYNEVCEETSSLLRLNEQVSSAFTDDESNVDELLMKMREQPSFAHSNGSTDFQKNNHLMKLMVLNKSQKSLPIDTTSDERTRTNSFSLNTYSQDFSIDRIYQYDSSTSSCKHFPTYSLQQSSSLNHPDSQISWCSSSTLSSSGTDKALPSLILCQPNDHQYLSAVEKKRNTSSDSDAITTTTTTLTTSTHNDGNDLEYRKAKVRDSITRDVLRAFNKLNATTITDETIIENRMSNEKNSTTTKPSDVDVKCDSLTDTFTREHDTSLYGSHDDPSSSLNNRASSKVTFESLMTQTSLPASPKTKDQSVMAQIDSKGRLNSINTTQEFIHDNIEIKNGRTGIFSEGTVTSGSTSAKSSVKEIVSNQKSVNHRKSKSQNRARKALRTITFILGAFVVCWTPWHIYSAIQSLCESCKLNWYFSNPMFHCVYFLCYLNSPINPFCYALANQQFKKTFTRILRLDLRRL